MKIDEYYNHYPTVNNINQYGIQAVIDTTKYLAANTPFPYLLTTLILKTFDIELNLRNLRLINIIISFFTTILIYKLFLKLSVEYPLEKTLIIFFYPYFIKPSFTYYMSIWGLLFYVLFILQLKSENKKYFLAGLFLSFAVLSQQFYLSIFLGLTFFLFISFINDKIKLTDLLKFILPIFILFFPLIFFWKGLVPPHFNFHSVGFDLTKITSILISIGVIAFPFVLYDLVKNKTNTFQNRNINKILISFTIVTLILILFFYPTLEKRGGFGKITGMTFNFINLISDYNLFIGFSLKFTFLFSGILFLYLLIINPSNVKKPFKHSVRFLDYFNLPDFISLLKILVLFFVIGFSFNILLAERHLLPLIVTILFLSLINFNNKLILRLLLLIYLIVGTSHFYYYLYIQNSY